MFLFLFSKCSGMLEAGIVTTAGEKINIEGLTLFNYLKARVTEREGERARIFYLLVHFFNSWNNQGWTERSQDGRPPNVWVPSAAFLGALTRSWTGSRAAETANSALWNASSVRSGLACYTTMPSPNFRLPPKWNPLFFVFPAWCFSSLSAWEGVEYLSFARQQCKRERCSNVNLQKDQNVKREQKQGYGKRGAANWEGPRRE